MSVRNVRNRDVLRYLMSKGQPATTKEIAQALGWPEQTVRNVVARQKQTFVAAGRVKRDKPHGGAEMLWSAWEE